ncbi:hypothetical protein [Streptomyces sp. AK02-04a]|nr:hypothetical protein [Streptomyces sp. AK02-04a]MDX3761709.1 hypothetical protein [Streptomyces sp. AK02-04a]
MGTASIGSSPNESLRSSERQESGPFGTEMELFVLAAAVPEVDDASMAEFTEWAMDHVKSLRSGLPGARNAAMILPAPAGGSVQPAARNWAAKDARILGRSLIGRPVTVESSASS